MRHSKPEMMASAWWLESKWLQLNGQNASHTRDNCMYSFDVSIDAKKRIVVAPTGRVRVQSTGHQDSDWRANMERIFGVRCALASEFSGQLYCPYTAKKIPVSRITNNPTLWVDREAKVAMLPYAVTYDTPTSSPVHGDTARSKDIGYSFHNAKRSALFLTRLKPILYEAKLRCSLADWSYMIQTHADAFGSGLMKRVLDTESIVDIESGCFKEGDIKRLAYMCDRLPAWSESIKQLCADKYTSTYLEYRE